MEANQLEENSRTVLKPQHQHFTTHYATVMTAMLATLDSYEPCGVIAFYIREDVTEGFPLTDLRLKKKKLIK